jgi:hypothetical protein
MKIRTTFKVLGDLRSHHETFASLSYHVTDVLVSGKRPDPIAKSKLALTSQIMAWDGSVTAVAVKV